jgi:hypothetical protein
MSATTVERIAEPKPEQPGMVEAKPEEPLNA